MKKTLPFAAIATALVFGIFSTQAQVKVIDTGQMLVGKRGTVPLNDLATSPKVDVPLDGVARLIVLGNRSKNYYGRIAFGDADHVLVGEDRGDNVLALKGDGGLDFRIGNTTYMGIVRAQTLNGISVRTIFSTAVWADAFNLASDLRLKTNVNPLGESWRSLSDVNSISYQLLPRPVLMQDEEMDSVSAPEPAVPEPRVRYGFAAQEIKEIFPDLVSEDEEGYLSIDYLGFIPLLVDAYKSLEARNGELEAKLDAVLNPVKKTAGTDGISLESVTLGQNRPNPFTESTVIDITLSADVSTAILCIYDMQGTQVLQLPVEGRGKTAVTVKGTSLRPGMYLYSLIADGEEVATKRMILTE